LYLTLFLLACVLDWVGFTVITGAEDGAPFAIGCTSVTDPDTPMITLTITPTIGELSYTGSLATSSTTPPITSLTLYSSPSDLTITLSLVTWTPSAYWNMMHGYGIVNLVVDDGTAAAVTYELRYDLSAVDNAPIITITTTPYTIIEDTATIISGISISDPDMDETYDATLAVTLQCSSGTMTLTDTTGITITTGDPAIQQSLIVFTSSSSSLPNVISSLTFIPPLHVYGSGAAIITITVNDQGYYGTGGPLQDQGEVTIDITAVNHVPTWVAPLPVSFSVGAGATVTLTGLQVADIDGTTSQVTITAVVSAGTLQLSTDGPAGSVSYTGTVSDANTVTVLGTGLIYTPTAGYYGSTTTITLTVTDASSASTTIVLPIYVSEVNQAPTVTMPSSPYSGGSVIEDVATVINGISIDDSDFSYYYGAVDTIVTTTSNGIITLPSISGMTCSRPSTYQLSCSGTLAELNTALSSLTYTGDTHYSGSDSLAIVVTDNMGASATSSLTINVIAVDHTLVFVNTLTLWNGDEDTPLSITSISLTDYDALTVDVTLTITCDNCTWGPAFTSATYVITGKVSDLDTALANLQYEGAQDYNIHCGDPDTITFTTTHIGPISSATMTSTYSTYVILAAENDAPVISLPAATITVNENSEVNLLGIPMWDVDAGEAWQSLVTITVDLAYSGSTSTATLRFDSDRVDGMTVSSSSTSRTIIIDTPLSLLNLLFAHMYYVPAAVYITHYTCACNHCSVTITHVHTTLYVTIGLEWK
jgi:hypothetical protein